METINKIPHYMLYTDKDNNDYQLVMDVYIPNMGNNACMNCAFKFGNSKACQESKSCTPTDNNRLLNSGYTWELIKLNSKK
jgi:hypothetical protein